MLMGQLLLGFVRLLPHPYLPCRRSSPGHTLSIAYSHPDIVSCAGEDWKTCAAEPPAGQLRPTSEDAISLVNDIFREVLQEDDGNNGQFFHTGGDEVNSECYASDPQLAKDLADKHQTVQQALADFTRRTHQTVVAAEKTPVVWEDSAVGQGAVPLDPRVIVMAWRGPSTLSSIVEAGHRVIQASYDPFYLDCGFGGWVSVNEVCESG